MDGEGRLSRALSTHGERVAAKPLVPSGLQAAFPLPLASTVLMPWHLATVCIRFENDGFREQRWLQRQTPVFVQTVLFPVTVSIISKRNTFVCLWYCYISVICLLHGVSAHEFF